VIAESGRRILAMGGGGFTMGELAPGLDALVLSLTGKTVPKVCFLPTASGDPSDQVARFHERFGSWPCEPSILSLFHLARDRIDPVKHLLQQDAIYVGGGSMRNLLAVWREHGIDEAMRIAWESGTVLAGLSAGAMCWFEGGVSMSAGAPAPVHGLGLLEGSLSVHLDGEVQRLPIFRRAIATGALAPGYAADDGAGLLFAGSELVECVASKPGARVLQIQPDGRGGVDERALPVRLIGGQRRGEPGVEDAFAVGELRDLRAGGSRWR
jgi:dipeptidase E